MENFIEDREYRETDLGKYERKLMNESSLSRVWNHFYNEKIPVALISAFRWNFPHQQNINRNRELAAMVRRAGYGYVYVDGAWKDDKTGELSYEDSILVIGNEDTSNLEFEKYLKQWQTLFDQDAVLVKKKGDKGIGTLLNKDGSEFSVGSMKPNKVGELFTKLRGRGERTFTLEDVARDELSWAGKLLIGYLKNHPEKVPLINDF